MKGLVVVRRSELSGETYNVVRDDDETKELMLYVVSRMIDFVNK